ncbi:MAG: ferrous iron transport protein A, partial [Frankiaceae bacterium]|nr:ferrous iron transport protein A [Frankiaceae bacterium]
PGLDELGDSDSEDFLGGLVALTEVPDAMTTVVVRRIGEPIQSDTKLLTRLRRAGFRPNTAVAIGRQNGRVLIGSGTRAVELDDAIAAHVFVTASA